MNIYYNLSSLYNRLLSSIYYGFRPELADLLPLRDYLYKNKPRDHVALKLLIEADSKTLRDSADNFLFRRACDLGLSKLALHLLRDPKVLALNTVQNNQVFLATCKNGPRKLTLALLKNPAIRDLAASNNNLALHYACKQENDALVLQLLSIPNVRALAANHDNEALFYLCKKRYNKAALSLMRVPQISDSIKHNFFITLRNACSYGLEKLAMHLLKYQHPLGKDSEVILELANNNFLIHVAMCLLKNPQLAMDISDHTNSSIVFWLNQFKNKKLYLQAIRLERMQDKLDSFKLFSTFKNNLKPILFFLDNTNVRTRLLPHAENCMQEFIEASLDKVIIKLLNYPEFMAHAAYKENFLLTTACGKGFLNLALRLLELENVKEGIVSHQNLEFNSIDEEVSHPNNMLIMVLVTESKKHMRPVFLKILTIRQQAGIIELPLSPNLAKYYFYYACKISFPELAFELLENPLFSEKIISYQSLFFASSKGLSKLAIKMLELPSIASQASNFNNLLLITACCSNQKRLAIQLLKLPAVQVAVTNYNHLALYGACRFALNNDKLVRQLIQFSDLSKCMDKHYISCPNFANALPFKIYFKNKLPALQFPSNIVDLNPDFYNAYINRLKDVIFTKYGNKTHCNLKLALAFLLFAKPWNEYETNNNYKIAVQHNKLISKCQNSLNANDKLELMNTLHKTHRALNYYFPLTCLPKQMDGLPTEIVHKIFAYDKQKSFVHLRYFNKQLNKNQELRRKLALL